jgi:AraC-like DNA-binding protein
MPSFRWPANALPAIRVAGRFVHEDVGYEPVYRSPTHALHVYDYPCTMRFDKRSIKVSAGDLTISPAGGSTAYDLPAAGKHLCVHFLPASGRGSRATTAIELPVHLILGHRRDYVTERLGELGRLVDRGRVDPVCTAAASAMLLELLLWLDLSQRTPHPRITSDAERAVSAAAEFVEARLGVPIAVTQIARSVGLSQNYLARLFRQRFGMTIPHYILVRRLEVARHLLAATDLPVKEIAARVGLCDLQHFNKQFRRMGGASPRAYRARIRGA